MKLIIMIIVLMIISLMPMVLGEGTTLYVEVTTIDDINAVIVENADGNIENTIYCNGASCTTNVNGGTIEIPEGQEFNYNSYSTSYGGGFSMYKLLSQLGREGQNYYDGKRPGYTDAWNLWSLLDTMFVSHKESKAVFNNVDYLGRKMDNLEARISTIEKLYNLENNDIYQQMVKDEEIRLYAIRTKDYTCFEDEMCVIVRHNN